MSSSIFEDGEYLTCPFDSTHKVISNHFKHHIARCSQHHPEMKTIKCLFNDTHKIKPSNYYDHLCECPDNPAFDIFKIIMTLYCDPDDYWLCPYDPDHKVLAKRFQYHIMRCAKANPHIRRVKCSFNATHLTTPNELFKHMSTCPDNQAVHDAIAHGMGDFNWEDTSSDKNERQMAVVMNGEDWDREAHTGQIFNDDELRQLNGQNDMWSNSVTPAVPSGTIPSRPQSSYLDRDGVLSSRPVTESPKQIPQTVASFEPKRSSAHAVGGAMGQLNNVADASLDSQFENIRRNMLATGVGRGRLPTAHHPPPFSSHSVSYRS